LNIVIPALLSTYQGKQLYTGRRVGHIKKSVRKLSEVTALSNLKSPYRCRHCLNALKFTAACYLLIPWSRVLLEKLTGLQLVKKFPTFYGT